MCLMEPDREDTQAGQELCAWLARRLRIAEVPEPVWVLLKEGNYVSEALESPKQKEKILVRPARRYLQFYRKIGGAASGPERARKETEDTSSYVPRLRPGDPVYERAYAAAPYLLKRLATLSVVESFRRRISAPLSREKARNLLRAPQSARGSESSRHARLYWDGLEAFSVDVE